METATTDIILSDQMDYEAEIKPPSFYKRFLSIKPQGAQNITFSGSNTPIIFEIPAGCHNLSKCELYFSIYVAPGGNIDAVQILPADYCSLFQTIRLTMAQATQDLIYIRDLDLYSKMVSQISLNSQFRPNYQLFCTSASRATIVQDVNNPGQNLNDFIYSTSVTNGIAVNTIDEMRYSHTLESLAAANQSRSLNFCIRLKDLVPDSIFSIDKTLNYGNVLRLELTTNTPNVAFIQKDMTGGLAVNTRFVPSTAVTNEMRDLRLCYFTEKDPKAIMLCKQLCSSAELHIPIVIPSSTTNTNAGNQQLAYRLSRNPNDRLFKSYHALFKRTGVAYTRANCANFFQTSERQNEVADANRYWTVDGKWQGNNCFELRINNDVMTRFEDAQDYMIHINQLIEKTNQHSLRSITSIYNYGVIPYVYDTDYSSLFDYSKNEHKGIDLSEEDIQINATFNAVAGQDGGSTYENYAMYVILRKCILKDSQFVFI